MSELQDASVAQSGPEASFVPRSSAALGHLRDTFSKHLFLPDTASVDFTAAVMVANRLPQNDPVWGMVVGSSGGGKTEAVQSVADLPEVHQLSSLTSKTFLSGKQLKRGSASLLQRMTDAKESVLVLKDFTTILSMRADDRAEIMAQLREIYDGRLVRETGMGEPLIWQGHIGFLAGVTPAIDLHHAVIGVLGERFLYLRLPEVDSERIAGVAVDEDQERVMRDELRAAMKAFVEGVPVDQVPEMTAEVRSALITLARRTAWARSSVPRDAYTREILQRPSLEAPTRITKQLRQLWRAAVLMGHEDPLGFVARVARDSTRPEDRLTAAELIAEMGKATSSEVRRHLRLRGKAGGRLLEDLEALEIIEVIEQGGEGRPHTYAVTLAASELFPSPKRPRNIGLEGERGGYIQTRGDSGDGFSFTRTAGMDS